MRCQWCLRSHLSCLVRDRLWTVFETQHLGYGGEIDSRLQNYKSLFAEKNDMVQLFSHQILQMTSYFSDLINLFAIDAFLPSYMKLFWSVFPHLNRFSIYLTIWWVRMCIKLGQVFVWVMFCSVLLKRLTISLHVLWQSTDYTVIVKWMICDI